MYGVQQTGCGPAACPHTTNEGTLKVCQNGPDQGATGVLGGYLDLVGKEDSEGRWLYSEFNLLLDSTIIKLQTTSTVAKVLNKAINLPPFSGKMNPLSLTKSTFKLLKVNTDRSIRQVTNVTVTPSSDNLTATLNPFGTSTTLLAKSTRYKVVVTTGAKDVAGNPRDQNPTTSGNQQMVWSFKTGLL